MFSSTNYKMTLLLLLIIGISFNSVFGSEPPTKRMRSSEITTEPPTPPAEVYYSAVENVGIYTNGLLIEQYNHSIVEEYYGDDMSTILTALIPHDYKHVASLPNKNLTFYNQQTAAHFILRLDRRLSRSTESTLFLSDMHGTEVVVKYQANCIELDFSDSLIRKNYSPYIHPLVVETIFAKKASKLGIAPNVHFLSPPTTLCENKTGTCSFSMDDDFYELCANHRDSSMRFIVSEFVQGVSLYEYKPKYMTTGNTLERALRIGEQLISMLEKLHTEAKIVHGDIHAGNIMVQGTVDGKQISLKLIDFGRAKANKPRSESIIREPYWVSHCLYSAWEMLGYTPTARDDVARAVQAIARLFFPEEYENHEGLIADISSQEIVKWKLEENFFEYSGYDPLVPFVGLNDTRKAEFRGHLLEIVELVRGMTQVNSVPPYAEIRSALMAAREIVVPFA